MRALIQFEKRERLRFVSHLDLQRFMQMALSRSELPVAYSQGYNPHAVMSFASALAMHWTSEYEILDVKMCKPVDAETVLSAMRESLPTDMPPVRVRMVDDRHPALMGRLICADYEIALTGETAEATLAQIPAFLAESSVIAMRKTKSGEKPTDIRPMAYSLTIEPTKVCTRLALTERDTLKPDLLIRALAERAGAEAPAARIHRKLLLGSDDAGALVPLMELAQ